MSINGQISIITGAGRGIGRATALRFAREGARVVLFSRTAAALDEVAAETARQGHRHPALPIAGDVSREDDVYSLFQQVMERYGRVDILVNCAAIVAVEPFVTMDIATWDRVINVNLRGTFLCCRAAFRAMPARGGGVIVNLSSLAGVPRVEKFSGNSAYTVSKFGVAGLTESLAVEGKPLSIRVVAVSPGAVDTEMLRAAAPHLKAGMTPEQLARILLFLVGPDAAPLHGTNLEIYSNE
jgi:NAD(P)-dependent dehydrogenase (short-subunit alcohol dehydrogenase family)